MTTFEVTGPHVLRDVLCDLLVGDLVLLRIQDIHNLGHDLAQLHLVDVFLDVRVHSIHHLVVPARPTAENARVV